MIVASEDWKRAQRWKRFANTPFPTHTSTRPAFKIEERNLFAWLCDGDVRHSDKGSRRLVDQAIREWRGRGSLGHAGKRRGGHWRVTFVENMQRCRKEDKEKNNNESHPPSVLFSFTVP